MRITAFLVAIGLAIPTTAQPPGLTQQPLGTGPGSAKLTDPVLTPVPTDSFYFVSVKASKLWDNPAAKPLREWVASQKPGPLDAVIGLPPADLDRLTLFAPTGWRDAALLLISTRTPYNEAKVLKALGVEQVEPRRDTRVAGRVVAIDRGEFPQVAFIDERTLLFLPDERSDETSRGNLIAQLIARKPDGPLATALATAHDHDLTVGLDVGKFAVVFQWIQEVGAIKELAPYLLLLQAKTATFTADFDKTAKGKLILTFPDAATAKRAAPVLEEGIKALVALLNEEAGGRLAWYDPIEKVDTGWAITVLKQAKVTTDGANVIATAEVSYQEDLAKFVAMLPKSVTGARSNRKASNNLKQLALAMHNYHDAMTCFPGDVGVGDKPVAWSWRIQLLPYVEQYNLYKQLDLTKAWDDPANLKKLESIEMPKLFEIPGRPAPKGYTYFRIFSMPKDAKGIERPLFKEGERGPRIASITDGTSNTFMIVEAGEAVPWYKPDVLAYDGKLPLPALGDKAADRFLFSLCDASVRTLRPSKLSEKTIRAMVTINGNEVIDVPE